MFFAIPMLLLQGAILYFAFVGIKATVEKSQGSHGLTMIRDLMKYLALLISVVITCLGLAGLLTLLIDNQSIYKSSLKSLREKISLVSQETTLFDDTIKNNIKYANPDATDEELLHVAKLSSCDEFIEKLPNKYDTLIGENGIRLSGGEKQRVSIARAMIKRSSIILLDEATSALDTETESKIQNALKILTESKTTIVIAHRLSTILNSNMIYVIDSGKVVDHGKHEDLLKKSTHYKNFYDKQIQK